MKIDKTKIKRILVVTLSNIGDAILTTPVIEVLRDNFPQAYLAVLVGPRSFSVFKSDSRINNKVIYDKRISWKNKAALVNRLRKEKYDLVVDLKQSAFALFLGARYRTSVFAKAPKSLLHMKDRHLWKLKSLGLQINSALSPKVMFGKDEQEKVKQMLKKWQLDHVFRKKIVVIAAGARNMTKRWVKEGYAQLIRRLIKEYNTKVIMVGDEQDRLLIEDIVAQVSPKIFNACGRTTIGELSFLLSQCSLLITNDSAPMHLAWALDTPVISIFGPTDHKKYAPYGPHDVVIRKNLSCSPCEQSLCPKGTRECLRSISADEVFAACKRILDEDIINSH